jgi:hypothetical protein
LVDNAGHADADSAQLAPRLEALHHPADRLCHLVDYEIATTRYLGLRGELLQELAALVNGGNAEIGAAQIDCYGVREHDLPFGTAVSSFKFQVAFASNLLPKQRPTTEYTESHREPPKSELNLAASLLPSVSV